MAKGLIAEGTTAKVYDLGNGTVVKKAKQGMWPYIRKEIPAYRIIGNTIHFPRMISASDKEQSIILTHCGEPAKKGNVPKNWKQQVEEIITSLTRLKICHRDIRLSNITVRGGLLYLVDFGHWGSSKEKNKDAVALRRIVGAEK